MENTLNMGRILSTMLIIFILTGFVVSDPDPEPAGGFVSVLDNKRKRADRHFQNFEYKSAIKLYNKLIAKNKADDIVKLRLAESYQKINDPVNAERWYAEVIHSDQVTPQHQIQYAHTLLSNGKYEEAREVINSYEFANSDYRSQAIINTLDKLEVFYSDSMYYDLNSVKDNKPEYSDFSPIAYKNGLVFVSSRNDKGPKFKWDETPFLDLYYTESDVASAVPFSESLNSKYHEGPIAFYDDYTKAVFTRSNYLDKELGITEEGINNLQLYTATWDSEAGDWSSIEPVNFIIGDYSYGHPSVSVDNNNLYFISDMPGGFGGTDLYVSKREEAGWGEPVNMGEVINTSGDEMYPFIDDENNLYFSSNGHGGLGGLDVFQIPLDEGSDIRNMGYPLNTTADDFGFSLTADGGIAYISSNREGVDNIYQIDIQAPDLEMILADNSVNSNPPQLDDEIQTLATSELSTMPETYDTEELSTINASIIDENSLALEDANLKLLVNGEEQEVLLSDDNGKVSILVPADQEYTIIASKEGFEDRTITLPAESLGQEEDLLIVMNSVFVDSDINEDQLPTTELDPLAVSAEPWEDPVENQSNRPDINGVALAPLPTFGDKNSEEDGMPTTELDPLAVSDEAWDDSYLDDDQRPEIQGVALQELPEGNETDENGMPTTELDPLAVSDEAWDDSYLDDDQRPEIQGVALSELPENSEGGNVDNYNNEDIPTNELDPLAVSDDAWDNSYLDDNQRPDIQGVALTEIPTGSEDNGIDSDGNEEMTTNELDPLAVSDEPWNDSYLGDEQRPGIQGVALSELPEDSEGSNVDNYNNEDIPTNELDPLAVSDNAWDNSYLDDNQRPDIQGVALTELPNGSEDNNIDGDGNEKMPNNELDPLAVSDDPWNDSYLSDEQRPGIQGVALSELPDGSDRDNMDNSEDENIPTNELDPLAVSDTPGSDSYLDNSQRPAVQGVALNEVPTSAEDNNVDNYGHEGIAANELDPLAVNDESWNDSYLDNGQRPAVQGVALNELPRSSNNKHVDNFGNEGTTATELDHLAINDSYLDESQNPTVQGVALSELPEDSESNNSSNEDITSTDLLSDSQNAAIESASEKFSKEPNSTQQLVVANAVDAFSGEPLQNADLKLFVDSPNEPLDYEINDGVLTFQVNPEEDYIIVASHDDYQDTYINMSGEQILADYQNKMDLDLTPNEVLADDKRLSKASEKFKAQVTDLETGALLEDAEVKFFVDGKAVESELSKENGKTVFKSPEGDDYMMLVSRKGYQDLIYHMPGAPEDDMDIDLAMLPTDDSPYTPYRQLAVNGQAFDDFSGADLDNITFKVFEDGNLIESTNDLSTIDVNPDKDYQVLASKNGYNETLVNLDPATLEGDQPVVLPFALQEQQISEVTGNPVYEVIDEEVVPIGATILDITDDQPLSEAMVTVFADNQIQEKLNTWTTGTVTINAVPGREYMLLITRNGYADKILNLGTIEDSADSGVEIALVPVEIERLRPSGIDLNNANMLVMADPQGNEQLYLSTDDELYQYTIENDNHYLINDDKKILLKERSRSMGSKVTTKQDSDQFNLRSEDQFLYDQLTADEKEMVDKIIDHLQEHDLSEDPELAIYYNNLPEEYRAMVDNMVQSSSAQVDPQEPLVASASSLDNILAENYLEVSEVFNVNNIYYDFDKSNIREDAARELDKLVLILQNNENIKVVMFSHADSRGSNSYNDVLSRKRGVSAIDYLVERGISKERLSAEGKGERQLVNSCGNSINCSEDAHQLNRRTEFILSA